MNNAIAIWFKWHKAYLSWVLELLSYFIDLILILYPTNLFLIWNHTQKSCFVFILRYLCSWMICVSECEPLNFCIDLWVNIHFFACGWSIHPDTSLENTILLPIGLPLNPPLKSIDLICESLFLDCLFWSVDLYVHALASQRLSWLL